MALFKVLRGSSGSFHDDLSQFHNWGADGSATLISNGAIALNPKFNDGFCYFLKDSRMFYIDYAIKDGNGNITERHRVPLNADDAHSIESTIVNRLEITDSDYEIPTAKLIKEEIARIDLLISQIGGDAIEALQNDKMDKVNPTGSGQVSINGTATGTKAVSFGGTASGAASVSFGNSTASANFAFAHGIQAQATGTSSTAIGRSATAEGQDATALGSNVTASGKSSLAVNNFNIAEGENSQAMGDHTHASGLASHSEGCNTTATHKAQHVEGEWNELDSSSNTAENRGTYVHITGIGTGETDRKNGFTIDWNGSIWGARSLAHGNNVTSSGENSYAGGNAVIASGVSSHAEGSNNEAKGASSHTEGDSTYASGSYAHAEGESTKAEGTAAHAEGKSTTASGNNSHAEGYGTVAEGEYSHAEGYKTKAAAERAHSEGGYTLASGRYSHAEGGGSNYDCLNVSGVAGSLTYTIEAAVGFDPTDYYLLNGQEYGRIIDYDSSALTITLDKTINADLDLTNVEVDIVAYTESAGERSHAEGYSTTASGTASHAEGKSTTASGNNSHAEGYKTVAEGEESHAEGHKTVASGNNSHAEGYKTVAEGEESHAEGASTTASGSYSHAEGSYTLASGRYSHAEGGGSIYDYLNVSGVAGSLTYTIEAAVGFNPTDYYLLNGQEYGRIIDYDSSALTITLDKTINADLDLTNVEVGIVAYTESAGERSHAEGKNTIAFGEVSHAEGLKTRAYGNYSHAEGESTKAEGTASHSEGSGTVAEGDYSHSEGQDTTASGNQSHAEGNNTTASGNYSHAEGDYTNAEGIASHSEGGITLAEGDYSHAEGNSTTASGNYSHAEGYYTEASGNNSHAQNLYTIAIGNAQTAMGKFNVEDATSLLIIGNGTADDARSNAFTVSESGIVYAQNRLNIAGLDLEQDAAKYTLFVNGPAFFSGTVKAAEPIAANDLTTKNYVDNNLPRMTHSWITATAGQSVFNFTTPDTGCPAVTDLANYYYVYFNGLLLIPGLHYTVSGATVTFVGWAAEAGDVCHVTGFKPISPAT